MTARELIVDSFAGGGGASLGISWALGRGPDIAINHDREAIALHAANHPESRHYAEDVWEVDPREATQGRPVGLMWLSPDCRHFSKAKGGRPVSPRVRGLAWIAVRWAKAVQPRVIVLENVEEFQTWGPLGPDDRPCKERKGRTFKAFVTRLRNLGYEVEWRELRACDYGAPTIRKRLFIIARRDGEPIVWPTPTHGKGRPHAWRTAAECIEWAIPCPSIFDRKRPLREKTLKRIARGLRKFVTSSPRPFIVPMQHEHRAPSVDEPLQTITTVTGHGSQGALVAAFLAKHYGEKSPGDTKAVSIEEPAPTITARATQVQVVTSNLVELRGTAPHGQSVEDPLHTISAGGLHHAEVRAFLVAYYGNERDGGDLFDPMRTLSTRDRFALVTVEGHEYVIADIGMRMLVPRELYRAQGFPDSYRIDIPYNGKPMTKTAQVRMCGNSVCPPLAEAIVRANVCTSGVRACRRSA
ncbi:MAG: DNA cytosine methyltransferase [Pirellulales bacterium]|nr:DNA cytosine methyltransferase [Pirellulales bacterium]